MVIGKLPEVISPRLIPHQENFKIHFIGLKADFSLDSIPNRLLHLTKTYSMCYGTANKP